MKLSFAKTLKDNHLSRHHLKLPVQQYPGNKYTESWQEKHSLVPKITQIKDKLTTLEGDVQLHAHDARSIFLVRVAVTSNGRQREREMGDPSRIT